MAQRGFSLIETLIAVAIVSLLVLAAFNLAAGARPAAARAATVQFDAALNYARALASAGTNGATIVLAGGQLTVYSGRPTSAGALAPAPVAPFLLSGASVQEDSSGGPPLALFVDGEGRVTVSPFSGATPAPMASEPSCPSSGFWQVRISDPRATITRSLPCSAAGSTP